MRRLAENVDTLVRAAVLGEQQETIACLRRIVPTLGRSVGAQAASDGSIDNSSAILAASGSAQAAVVVESVAPTRLATVRRPLGQT